MKEVAFWVMFGWVGFDIVSAIATRENKQPQLPVVVQKPEPQPTVFDGKYVAFKLNELNARVGALEAEGR